ncbi:MAG: assimilatory nitrate reductase catalytic subunit [Fuerstiella sp.]
MAREPDNLLPLIDRFGPSLAETASPSDGSSGPFDRQVETHCCFCGQQCGVTLNVKDNQVVGFEPRYDFPFNEGMLCPKGVKRYLQGGHPDRLTSALKRDERLPDGFVSINYERAVTEVAEKIEQIQQRYGPQGVGILSGASLTTEKAYLMGKFARVCLKTPYIDYNGRLCMVSAAAANKQAFGIDRAANPWSDIVGADVVWISGANIAECAPITTNYVWQAREMGGRIIVVDPRITPIARTADLFLPIRPGTDAALFNGVLKIMIDRDWIDHDFIRSHTEGFETVAQHVAEWDLQRTAKQCGLSTKRIEQAAEMWGTAATSFLLHARGIEHHSNGVENCLGAINIVLASGRLGRRNCGYATITGQANGQGGREHGQKCDQLPGGRDISNPEHREHISRVWNVDADSLPGPGVDCYEMMRKIHAGEIRMLLTLCFNPKVSLPDSDYVTAALNKLDFMVSIDFFLSETARHANIVLPGSLQEEDEGVVTQIEGRVIKINQAVDPPGDARQDWKIIQDIAARLDRTHGFTFESPAAIFDELRQASRGGIVDYSGISYEKIDRQQGVFWPCPDDDHPGTERLFEQDSWNPVARGAGPFYFPDGRARFKLSEYRPPAEVTDDDFPVILTTGRVVSQFLSGTQTRRIGPLVRQYPEPKVEIHPHLAGKLNIVDGAWITVESRRSSVTLKASVVKTIRPDTVFVPYHWAGRRSINRCTIAAQDPQSKIPEFKVCACRVFPAEQPPHYEDAAEPCQHPVPELPVLSL